MKIDVVDRRFLKRKSRNEWLALLAGARVISIRSSAGWDDSFPVPLGVRPHDRLLCLTFDDSTGLDDWSGRNPDDHAYFLARNHQVRPNVLVLRLIREVLTGVEGGKTHGFCFRREVSLAGCAVSEFSRNVMWPASGRGRAEPAKTSGRQPSADCQISLFGRS